MIFIKNWQLTNKLSWINPNLCSVKSVLAVNDAGKASAAAQQKLKASKRLQIKADRASAAKRKLKASKSLQLTADRASAAQRKLKASKSLQITADRASATSARDLYSPCYAPGILGLGEKEKVRRDETFELKSVCQQEMLQMLEVNSSCQRCRWCCRYWSWSMSVNVTGDVADVLVDFCQLMSRMTLQMFELKSVG